ncbi:MAG: hypothetical protein BGO67_01710 [Alphaproteobacteria bacterium 41-28]|nr:MAG: hypothetical protein BGO67_01710 [Alphaproteobacteria bacterium 41-28]
MKDKNIVRYTRHNLPKGNTDWAKVKNMSDAEIEAAAQSDPDNPIWTDEMFASAVLHMPHKKVPVHMYLDQEIVTWFKSKGKGYQTRINAVLKSYIAKHLHKHP